MRETLLHELQEFGERCGVSLDDNRFKGQVMTWLNDWGNEHDDVIREAFVRLRDPAAVRGTWPRYHEVAAAFALGREVVRRRRQHEGKPAITTEAPPSKPHVLTACALYAALEQSRGTPAEKIYDDMDQFFGEQWTAARLAKFCESARRELAELKRVEVQHVSDTAGGRAAVEVLKAAIYRTGEAGRA